MSNISIKIFWGILLFAASCGSEGDDQKRNAAALGKTSDSTLKPDGMAVFRQKCVTCHGADGALGLNGAKDFSQSVLTLEERINIITNGKKLMTPFGTILSPEEIKAVAEYTQTFKK
ncbi:MAG: cytochrome c [Saprospiraceae bacterium]|nr:cytochrome c [Saprospiraceae bacterium]